MHLSFGLRELRNRRSTIASKLFTPDLRLPEQDGAKLLDLGVPPAVAQDVERGDAPPDGAPRGLIGRPERTEPEGSGGLP